MFADLRLVSGTRVPDSRLGFVFTLELTMRIFMSLVLLLSITMMGCKEDKSAQPPKEYAPMPGKGPVGASAPTAK